MTVGWSGYYSSITPVYQNGSVVTPDTSSNTVLAQANWATLTTGFITKNTGLSYNTLYYYDISLNNGNSVATGIARQSIYTSANGSSSAPTPIDTVSIRVNWTGIYSTVTVTSVGGTVSSTGNSYPSSSTPQTSVIGNVLHIGLTSNTQYTYTTTLNNGNVVGTSLTNQSAYTYPAAPTTLAIAAATVTDKTLTLTFISSSPNASTLTYILYGTNYGTLGTVNNTSGSNYSVPITALTSNSAYSIQLTGKNTTSTLESSKSTAITGNTCPSAPTFTAAAGVTSSVLTITKPSGTIDVYNFSFIPTGPTITQAPTSYTANCNATIGSLTQNSSYTFYISAKNNASGLVSANGSLAFITDAAAPTSVSASAGVNSTTLTWTDPTGTISSYTITGGGTVGTKSNTGTPITDLTSNTPYTFSVKVTGLSGNPSAASNVAFQTNPDNVTSILATGTDTGATLTWTNPSGTITGFSCSQGTLGTPTSLVAGASSGATLTYGTTAGNPYSLILYVKNDSYSSSGATFTYNIINNLPTIFQTANNYRQFGSFYLFEFYPDVNNYSSERTYTFKISGPKTVYMYYFIVGGGGSGSGGNVNGNSGCGGGGGGGILNNVTTTTSFPPGNYKITIGAGGIGPTPGKSGANGGSTSIEGPSGFTTITITGGNGGKVSTGDAGQNPGAGGSANTSGDISSGAGGGGVGGSNYSNPTSGGSTPNIETGGGVNIQNYANGGAGSQFGNYGGRGGGGEGGGSGSSGSPGIPSNSTPNGDNGSSPGCGGGAAKGDCRGGSNSNVRGGNGAAGSVNLWCLTADFNP